MLIKNKQYFLITLFFKTICQNILENVAFIAQQSYRLTWAKDST